MPTLPLKSVAMSVTVLSPSCSPADPSKGFRRKEYPLGYCAQYPTGLSAPPLTDILRDLRAPSSTWPLTYVSNTPGVDPAMNSLSSGCWMSMIGGVASGGGGLSGAPYSRLSATTG